MMLKNAGRKTAAWLTVLLLVMSCLLVSVHAEGSDTAVSQSSQTAAAEETPSDNGQMNLDVVFVLDASGSMIKSDPNKVALDAYRLFCDLLDDSCGIGYVVFTHELLSSSEVVNISDKAALTDSKNKMASVKYDKGGFTDIALGLTKAKDLLTAPEVKNDHREKVIILLTDGNTALPKDDPRTLEKSNDEMDATLMALYDYHIPVYAIGLNYDGRMKQEEMQRIANETNGVWYETTTSEELVKIFSDVFGNIYQLNGEQKEIVEGNVQITVADNSVFTVSVIVRSSLKMEELNPKLYDPSGKEVSLQNNKDISVSTTSSYTMIKIFYPDEGNWRLHLDKANNDNCVVTQMDYYSIYLEQKVSTPAPTGQPLKIETTIKNSDGVLQDKRLLDSITMNVKIVSKGGKQVTKLMKSDAAGVYYCEWQPEEAGDYTVTTIAETPKFKKNSKSEPVEIMTPEDYENYLKGAGRGEEAEGHKDSGNAWFTIVVILISLVVALLLIFAITVIVRNVRRNHAVSGQAEEPDAFQPTPAVQPPQPKEKAPPVKPATPPELVDYEIVEHDALENLIKKGPDNVFNASADDYQSDAALEALIRKGPDNTFAVGKDKLPEEMDEDEEYGDEYGDEYEDDAGGLDEEYEDSDDDDDGNNPLAGLNIRKD